VEATHEGARQEGERPARPTFVRSQPGTLLHQPGIRVTGRWFIVGSRRYDVTELSHLRTVRGRHDPLTTRAVVTTGVVLAAVGAVMIGSTALLVPLVLAWLGYRLRPRPFELWADYRGTTIQLFSSDSEREYGQVCRALVRAREIARLGGTRDPWASIDPWGPIPR